MLERTVRNIYPLLVASRALEKSCGSSLVIGHIRGSLINAVLFCQSALSILPTDYFCTFVNALCLDIRTPITLYANLLLAFPFKPLLHKLPPHSILFPLTKPIPSRLL